MNKKEKKKEMKSVESAIRQRYKTINDVLNILTTEFTPELWEF